MENPGNFDFTYDNGLEQFVCSTCSAEFQTESEVKQHISLRHVKSYTCVHCGEVHYHPYSFASHVQAHNPKSIFQCPICSYSSSRRTSMATHIKIIHLNEFKYTCKLCGKGFTDRQIFIDHENEHSGQRPYQCVVCQKTFVYLRLLTFHQVNYHRVGIEGQFQAYQCKTCLRVLRSKISLDNHVKRRHTSQKAKKRYLCDICGKGFNASDKHKIHYRQHTGEKPYQCQFCEKSFTCSRYLVMHERIHTGEKPYKCEQCGKCFNQKAPLAIHKRIHTGEKPYICHICSNGFICRAALNKHLKSCMGVS